MPTPILWKNSLRYLLRHPVLIGLSVLGVALGVAVVVAIDLANTSAREAFSLSAETVTGRATHQIVGAGDGLDEAFYRDLRVDLGVRDAAPVVEGFARAPAYPGRTFQVLGIDPLADAPFRAYTGGVGSDLDLGLFIARPQTGLMAGPTAEALGLAMGDTLALTVGGVDQRLVLIGLLDPGDERSAKAMDNLLVVDIATAQTLFDATGRLSRLEYLQPDGRRRIDVDQIGLFPGEHLPIVGVAGLDPKLVGKALEVVSLTR